MGFGQDQPFFQCCGSGMFIPDPGSRILIFTHPGSRIPDLGSKNSYKERGKKKFVVIPYFIAIDLTKL
jgi:hypothetical protein